MHYKNGRAAKNGDMIVNFNGTFSLLGMLHSVSSTSDTCNGRLAVLTPTDPYINLKDCLHVDDIAAVATTVPDTSVNTTGPSPVVPTAAARPPAPVIVHAPMQQPPAGPAGPRGAQGPAAKAAAVVLAVGLVVGMAALVGCATRTVTSTTPAGVVTHTVEVNTNNLALDCTGVQALTMVATIAVTVQDPSAEPELRMAQVSLTAALKGADSNTVAMATAALGNSTNAVMKAQMGKIIGSMSSLEQSLLAKYGPTVAEQILLAIAGAVCDGMTAGLAGEP